MVHRMVLPLQICHSDPDGISREPAICPSSAVFVVRTHDIADHPQLQAIHLLPQYGFRTAQPESCVHGGYAALLLHSIHG